MHMYIQVLGATSDGASVNRRLVKVHDLKAKLTFKVPNVYANDRDIFFFSDPPHLMKTTRNCWASNTRSLWVCCNICFANHTSSRFLYRIMVMTSLGHTSCLFMSKMEEGGLESEAVLRACSIDIILENASGFSYSGQ